MDYANDYGIESTVADHSKERSYTLCLASDDKAVWDDGGKPECEKGSCASPYEG